MNVTAKNILVSAEKTIVKINKNKRLFLCIMTNYIEKESESVQIKEKVPHKGSKTLFS